MNLTILLFSYFADTLANSEASKHTIAAAQAVRDRVVVITSIQHHDQNPYTGVKPSPLTNPSSSGPTNNRVVTTVYAPNNSLP